MGQKYKQKDILTSVYVNCIKTLIQIVILYERSDFLWIGVDEFKYKSKSFGDVPRAINK